MIVGGRRRRRRRRSDRESLWSAGQRGVLSRLASPSQGHSGTDWTPNQAGPCAAPTRLLLPSAFTPRLQRDDMERRLGLFLLVCFGMLHWGEWTRRHHTHTHAA